MNAFVCLVVLLVALVAVPAQLGAAETGVNLGSKTAGLGTGTSAQPSPVPTIRIGPDGVPQGATSSDTPGKTGLGNTGADSMGGAAKGPGTQEGKPVDKAPDVPKGAVPPASAPGR